MGGILARVWLAPAALTAGLGLWRIGRPGLWADELATWGAARMPPGQLLRMLTEADAANLAYYLLMSAWVRVAGESETALRLPSLAAMTAAAGLLAVLGRRLVSYRAGLAAGLVFALLPITSRYAQEARVYAIVILLAVAAALLLVRFKLILYGFVVAGLGWLHMVALLLIPAHAIVVTYRARSSHAVQRWAVAATAGVLAAGPLAWLSAQQRTQVSWIPPPTLRAVITLPDRVAGGAAVAGFLLALAILAISKRRVSVLAISWALVPPLILLLCAPVVNLFWWRYLLFTVPALALLAGFALARARTVPLVLGLLTLGAIGMYPSVSYRAPDGHEHDTRGAAAVIAAHSRPGDAIAYALNEPVVPWEARDLVARYVPGARQPRDAFALTPQRTAGNFLATECPPADLSGCLGGAPRLWIIRYESHPDPLAGIGTEKEALLRSQYTLEQLWTPRSFTVALYARKLA
ncbi:glycosyltransferase family 39 protein [Longispora albida]|uniref:glycosyltransferase family 39 protein n=1 Tax=Longispora albida TaxID=203523 RepID=UPI000379A09C|nr:hypothetical protein [Longispora albida]